MERAFHCEYLAKLKYTLIEYTKIYTVQSISSSLSKWGGGAGRFVDLSGVGGSGKSNSSSRKLQNLSLQSVMKCKTHLSDSHN